VTDLHQLHHTDDPLCFLRKSDGLTIRRIPGPEFSRINVQHISSHDQWVAFDKFDKPLKPMIWGRTLELAATALCRHEGLDSIEIVTDSETDAETIDRSLIDDPLTMQVIGELAKVEADALEGGALVESLRAELAEARDQISVLEESVDTLVTQREDAKARAEQLVMDLLPDLDSRDLDDVVAAAIAAHEINRLYCCAIGDRSQLPWHEAPHWQRSSAILGAQMIKDDPTTTPEQSHQNWMKAKLADGWTYGPIKDIDAKTHPCLLPYEQLPPEQRVKDTLFGATVRGVLSSRDDIPF